MNDNKRPQLLEKVMAAAEVRKAEAEAARMIAAEAHRLARDAEAAISTSSTTAQVLAAAEACRKAAEAEAAASCTAIGGSDPG